MEQGEGGGKKPSRSKLALETKMAGAKKISSFSIGTHLYKYKNRSKVTFRCSSNARAKKG